MDKPLGRAGVIIVLLTVILAGAFVYWLFDEDDGDNRVLDAVEKAGIGIASAADGRVLPVDPRVEKHTVFIATDGKKGHIIITERPLGSITDMAYVVALYVAGGLDTNVVAWSSNGDRKTIVVLIGETTWTERQRDALDREITDFK